MFVTFRSSPSSFTLRAGEWDTKTKNEPLPHQERHVSALNVHPNYKAGILHNDFALLIVDRPFRLADNVETICLPNPGQGFDFNNCQVTGWGKDNFGNVNRSLVLFKLDGCVLKLNFYFQMILVFIKKF